MIRCMGNMILKLRQELQISQSIKLFSREEIVNENKIKHVILGFI